MYVDNDDHEDVSFRHPGAYNMDSGDNPENSLRETTPLVLLPEQPMSYEIITGGTVKGDLFADNQGYTYALSRRCPRVTTWCCSKRGQKST